MAAAHYFRDDAEREKDDSSNKSHIKSDDDIEVWSHRSMMISIL